MRIRWLSNKRRDDFDIPWIALLGLFLLSIVLIALTNQTSGKHQLVFDSLKKLITSLPLLYGIVAISYGCRYWRWRLLLNQFGIGKLSWPDFWGWFHGFALTATPGKLGELSRVQELHLRLNYPRVPLINVFISERLGDLTAVLVLLLTLSPAEFLNQVQAFDTNILLIITGLIFLALCVLKLTHQKNRFRAGLKYLKGYFQDKNLRASWAPITLISIIVWANEALVLWLLVQLISDTSISVPSSISIYLLSGSAGMASSLPGGIGINETTTIVLLHQLGIPTGTAFSIAVLRRIITLWSIVLFSSLIGLIRPISPSKENNF